MSATAAACNGSTFLPPSLPLDLPFTIRICVSSSRTLFSLANLPTMIATSIGRRLTHGPSYLTSQAKPRLGVVLRQPVEKFPFESQINCDYKRSKVVNCFYSWQALLLFHSIVLCIRPVRWRKSDGPLRSSLLFLLTSP